MSDSLISPDEIIFGLDIGTRTVIGLVGYKKEDEFHVLASKTIEHESRAMIDGQIHDIGKVAKIASQVKKDLESKTGYTFNKVSIAAAGRSLKTYNVSVSETLDEKTEMLVNTETIKALEVEGLNKAQGELVKELNEAEKYFCVGYSVVNYYLDGLIITNLEGHKGKKIAADVLATFLPQIVVDSLYAVVERIGLEVASMTLEPIAAINVVIPENLRLLNLALVDVGAGTSDIAVTKDGSISAYGMIPIAGDEITEKLVHTYLIDFQTGEKVKQQIADSEEIEFEDILGISHVATKQELLNVIEPIVERLASEVAAKICLVNGGKSTSAVFCVGGSSQIPGFIDKLCSKLEIPKERVAVRGSEALIKIKFPEGEKLTGPMYVTPIGICITSALDKGYDFIYVSVNGDIVELMKSKDLTVLDAAIAKGFDHTNLINRKGNDLLFRLNGSIKKIKGEFGIPAELFVNDEIVSLDSIIKEDDKIKIVSAINGKDAKTFVKDFIEEYTKKDVYLNGNLMELNTFAMINGKMVSIDDEIHNDDEVFIFKFDTVKDLCNYSEIDLTDKEIYLNGQIVSQQSAISQNDHIEIKSKTSLKETIQNKITEKAQEQSNKIVEDKQVNKAEEISTDSQNNASTKSEELETAQNQISTVQKEEISVTKEINVEEASLKKASSENEEDNLENINRIIQQSNFPLEVIVNGKAVTIKDKRNLIFVDIFNYINFDLSKPQGIISLKLNGRKANYTDPIRNGDYIEISWEKL